MKFIQLKAFVKSYGVALIFSYVVPSFLPFLLQRLLGFRSDQHKPHFSGVHIRSLTPPLIKVPEGGNTSFTTMADAKAKGGGDGTTDTVKTRPLPSTRAKQPQL